jgi:hypothetical protein
LTGIAPALTPLPVHQQSGSTCLAVKHITISGSKQVAALKAWTLKTMLSALAFDLSVLGPPSVRTMHISQYMTALKTVRSTTSCATAVPVSDFSGSMPAAVQPKTGSPDGMAFNGYKSVGKVFFKIDGLWK